MAEALDLSLYAKPAGDGTLGMDVAAALRASKTR